jgi:hypothetical protein
MLSGVAAGLLLLIVVLAIPVVVTFHLSWREAFQNDTELRWAFGLVRIRLPSQQSETRSPKGKEPEAKATPIRRSSRKKHNVFAAVWQKSFRRRISRFIGQVWNAVHMQNLTLRLRIGLGDPADTGQLWAFFGPAAGLLANVHEASIEIEPEFFDTTIELDSSGSIRLIPLQIIYLSVALLLSPSVWQGIRQMRGVMR